MTVAVIRGRCRGDRLRRLPSKPQKFAAVKGQDGKGAFHHQGNQDTIPAGHDPGTGYFKTMKALTTLQRQILRCTQCPRLVEYRMRVAREKRRQYREWEYWGKPLPSFGDPQARLLIIGLAPAAHGGNRTGRMFTGDQSGDWVYGTLHRFGFANQPTSQHRDDGLTLHDAYITAAARCVPPDNKPSGAELTACRPYLRHELQFLRQVRVVVPLGKIAFDAYLTARRELHLPPPNARPAFGHGASTWLPEGILLLASYHPSRQNTQTGRLTQAMFDAIFARARRELDLDIPSPPSL
jgi:uracil-DNA glycosylase